MPCPEEFGNGQLKHLGGLNVRHLPELLHQFRDIHKPGEPGIQTITGPIR